MIMRELIVATLRHYLYKRGHKAHKTYGFYYWTETTLYPYSGKGNDDVSEGNLNSH